MSSRRRRNRPVGPSDFRQSERARGSTNLDSLARVLREPRPRSNLSDFLRFTEDSGPPTFPWPVRFRPESFSPFIRGSGTRVFNPPPASPRRAPISRQALLSVLRPYFGSGSVRQTVCGARRARRGVLFAKRVAGRRGSAPGPYRRTINSAYGCTR